MSNSFSMGSYVIANFKKEITNLKNEFLHAGDKVKEKCYYARKALQVQIEAHHEKLNTIHEYFLKEIDAYEANTIRNFKPGNDFGNKMNGFVNQADETFKKIERKEVNDVQSIIALLRYQSRVMMSELENSFIEFKHSDVVISPSVVGHVNYRKSSVNLNGLQDMQSIDLSQLSNYTNFFRSTCVRLNAEEFLIVVSDAVQKFRCIKFDTFGKELKSIDRLGDLSAIKLFKICKFGSYIYFYTYVEKKDLPIKKPQHDLSPEFHRIFLIQCDLDLKVCIRFEIFERLYSIAVNSSSVYCLKHWGRFKSS
jgi:hypothetical protein